MEEEDNNKKVEGSDNSIFIGGKPFMNYVTGVVMQFTTKGADEVIVKARGKFISRAVDVVEVVGKNVTKYHAGDEVFALVDPLIKALVVDIAAIDDAGFALFQKGRDKGSFGPFTVGQRQVTGDALIEVKAQVGFGFTLSRGILGPPHRQTGVDQAAIDGGQLPQGEVLHLQLFAGLLGEPFQ